MVELKKLWFFAGWNHLSQEKRKLILDFNVTDVVLGANVNTRKFVFYNREKIENDCKWLAENNIGIHIMPWVNCKHDFLIKMSRDLIDLITSEHEKKHKIKSVLLDVEKHWYKNTYKSNDFIESSHLAIKKYIVPFQTYIKRNYKVELGTTSLLLIPEKVKPLAEISDYTIPQAYSVYFPSKKNHWSHDYIFEPGVSQIKAFNAWQKYSKKIVMGLACYYERKVGSWGQRENLDKCLSNTLELGMNEVAYWDIKQCVGSSKQKENRREFMKTLIKPIQDNEFDGADWVTLQKALNDFHFNPGPFDGIPGQLTFKALNDFRNNFDLKQDVDVNIKDLITLLDNYAF